MSVIADLIRAGVDPDLVARVADEITAAAVASSVAKRSKHAEAQARYHAKKQAEKTSPAIISDQNDQNDQVAEGKNEMSPTPPERKNPPSKENPPKGGQKKGSRLPADWQPRPDDWNQAVNALGAQRAASELAKFRDYWLAADGKNAVKRDWHAAWRNWIRTASEFAARAGPRQSSGSVLARLATEPLDYFDDQPSEQRHARQTASPADPRRSGFAGPLSERGGDDGGGPLLDLRPEGAGW